MKNKKIYVGILKQKSLISRECASNSTKTSILFYIGNMTNQVDCWKKFPKFYLPFMTFSKVSCIVLCNILPKENVIQKKLMPCPELQICSRVSFWLSSSSTPSLKDFLTPCHTPQQARFSKIITFQKEKKRFVLNEMFQRNDSKFAIFHV